MVITHEAYYKEDISSCYSDESPWLRGMVLATLIIYWVLASLIIIGVKIVLIFGLGPLLGGLCKVLSSQC